MSAPLATVGTAEHLGRPLMRIDGEIDISNADAVGEQIRATADPAATVVLDLSPIRFLDSSGGPAPARTAAARNCSRGSEPHALHTCENRCPCVHRTLRFHPFNWASIVDCAPRRRHLRLDIGSATRRTARSIAYPDASRVGGRRCQLAAMPSPPAVSGTVTEPVAVRVPSVLIR